MSKLTKFISALFAAAAALTDCQIDSPEVAEAIGKDITVSFSAEVPETRTVFGDATSSQLSVLWTKSQKVRIFPSTSYANAIDASVVPSRDKLTASFNGEITLPASTARVSFALLSPASAFDSNDGATVRIAVPSNQTPTESSTDENAQILIDKTQTFYARDGGIPDKVTFHPTHLTAYMALSFKNIPASLGKNVVCEVKATVPLSGTVDYNFSDGTLTNVTTSNSVKAAVVSPTGLCFFACLPAEVGGKNLTITLKGVGSVSKTIRLPSGKNFRAGKLAVMTIDFDQTVSPTGVTVSPTSLELNVGESATLTATVSPSNATNKTVTWSSSAASVATVDSDGKVVAVAPGSAVITATTVNGKTATCNVTVEGDIMPTGISISPSSLTLSVGQTGTLTATITPSNATNKTVNWSSSSSSVATVSSSGVVTAKAVGTTNITATTANGKRAFATVTVTSSAASRIELSVRRADNTDYCYDADEDVYHMSTGGSKNLYYTVYYADGSSSSDSGAQLSIVSGSGIQLSGDKGVLCLSSGKTAVVRYTSTTTPSVYTDLTIKTWDPAQSITLSQDNGFLDDETAGWVKEGSFVILTATISPSTARQKAVFTVTDSNGNFTVTRQANTAFKVQAPTINGATVYDYTSKYVKIKIIDQTGSKSVTQQIVPTNLELTVPKMFDVVMYNETDKAYEILDGGLRVLIPASGGTLFGVKEFYCDEGKANYTPSSSSFVPVGVVTYYNASKSLPCSTLTSFTASSRPYAEYNVGKYYHFNLSNSYFHGFAIALNDRGPEDWSDDFKNRPESSSHWNTSLGSTRYSQYVQGDDPYRAFDLTVLAAYYNGHMGSEYTIRPVNYSWNYSGPGFEYDVSAWPGSVSSYKMRPWVTPTVWNYRMLMNGDQKMNSDVIDVINWRISNLGGTKIFQNAGDCYWTINTDSDYAEFAYSVGKNSINSIAKITADQLFRPFMVF